MNSEIMGGRSSKSSTSKNPRWSFLSNLNRKDGQRFTMDPISSIKVQYDVQTLVESHAFGDVYLITTEVTNKEG